MRELAAEAGVSDAVIRGLIKTGAFEPVTISVDTPLPEPLPDFAVPVLNDAQQQQCDEWITLLDGEFKRNLDSYKYPHRYHVNTDTETYTCDPLEHRKVCVAILAQWNEVLESNGPFLFGGKPSFADYVILPFVRQFRIADQGWFDSVSGYDALKRWLDAFLESPALDQAMVKYSPWQPGDAPLTFPG